jgi:hypothetical protein
VFGSERLLNRSFPESIHPALVRSSENVGAPTFKVLLEDLLQYKFYFEEK